MDNAIYNVAKVSLEKVKGRINYLSDMPDEKREEKILKLRNTIKEVRPFIDEIKILLQDIPPQDTSKNTRTNED